MGIIAALVGMFIVGADQGECRSPTAGWPGRSLRSFLINGCWGIGVGLILPLLMPRGSLRSGGGLQTSR